MQQYMPCPAITAGVASFPFHCCREKSVITPTGNQYVGVDFAKKLCGVRCAAAVLHCCRPFGRSASAAGFLPAGLLLLACRLGLHCVFISTLTSLPAALLNLAPHAASFVLGKAWRTRCAPAARESRLARSWCTGALGGRRSPGVGTGRHSGGCCRPAHLQHACTLV